MSDYSIYLKSFLVLIPPLIAGVGGYFVFRRKSTPKPAMTAQLITVTCLSGFAYASYLTGLPRLFWMLEVLVVLPFLISGLSLLPIIARLSNFLKTFRRWDLALLGFSPLVLLMGYWQINAMTEVEEYDLVKELRTTFEHEKAKEIAFTDRHRPIPLFEMKSASKEAFDVSGDQGLAVTGTPMPYRAVRLTDPSGSSNCIGWVFAGGRYEMQCKDVNAILEDNGYAVVKSPRIGDLVIYRDGNNEVNHAGTVKLLAGPNQPLIESKWGLQGVFLHLPEGCPFGTAITYYHSSRPNKHLLITGTEPVLPESTMDSDP